MNGPLAALLAFLTMLGVSAKTQMHAVVLGQPVNIPVLWLVAAIFALVMLAAVLFLARLLIRDGLRLRPGTVS